MSVLSTSDHKRLAAWYRDNLGLTLEDWGGATLRWPEDHAEDRGLTVWHVAERDSKWFSQSTSSFMINYRVDDLTALLAQLKKKRRRDREGSGVRGERQVRVGHGPRRQQGGAVGADPLGRKSKGA